MHHSLKPLDTQHLSLNMSKSTSKGRGINSLHILSSAQTLNVHEDQIQNIQCQTYMI